MAALKLGSRAVGISLNDIKADEFQAMLIVAEERDLSGIRETTWTANHPTRI
jgi:hypothetical protein